VPYHKSRSARAAAWARRLKIVLPIAGVGLLFATSGLLYAAHTENNDAFCASCHTHPESEFYARSQAAPVDLASAHTSQDVACIDCHSGVGVTGRLNAMATVALPDLAAYTSGSYHDPAVLTVPISDVNCPKCHSEITAARDFRNHFHRFLPQWQALAPGTAATCVDCHQSHVTGSTQQAAFLQEAPTRQVCQRCHEAAGEQ